MGEVPAQLHRRNHRGGRLHPICQVANSANPDTLITGYRLARWLERSCRMYENETIWTLIRDNWKSLLLRATVSFVMGVAVGYVGGKLIAILR